MCTGVRLFDYFIFFPSINHTFLFDTVLIKNYTKHPKMEVKFLIKKKTIIQIQGNFLKIHFDLGFVLKSHISPHSHYLERFKSGTSDIIQYVYFSGYELQDLKSCFRLAVSTCNTIDFFRARCSPVVTSYPVIDAYCSKQLQINRNKRTTVKGLWLVVWPVSQKQGRFLAVFISKTYQILVQHLSIQ